MGDEIFKHIGFVESRNAEIAIGDLENDYASPLNIDLCSGYFRKKNNISRKNLILILSTIFLFLILVNSYVQFKKGELNQQNIEISEAKKSPLFDNGKCKFSSNETNFYQDDNMFNIRFKKCLKEKKDKFIKIFD